MNITEIFNPLIVQIKDAEEVTDCRIFTEKTLICNTRQIVDEMP